MNRGFTLLELIVAVSVLLLIGFFALVWPERHQTRAVCKAATMRKMHVLATGLDAYYQEYKALPGITHPEMIQALTGDNDRQIKFLGRPSDYLSEDGEILDAWGTPYHFTSVDTKTFEITSAGPNRSFGDDDDLDTSNME